MQFLESAIEKCTKRVFFLLKDFTKLRFADEYNYIGCYV